MKAQEVDVKKQTYLVKDGVPVVNGRKVSDSRRVDLTDDEARYDLALGRIKPEKNEKRAAARKTAAPAVESGPDAGD